MRRQTSMGTATRLTVQLFVGVMSLAGLFNYAVGGTFGSGDNTFDIEFVTIGDPGNFPDTTGAPNPAGSVDYVYRIGKFEVSRDMVTKANAEGDLGIALDPDFVTGGPRPDMPATGVGWRTWGATPSRTECPIGRHAAGR